MSDLDALAARLVLGHHIRSPLTVLKGYLSLLDEGVMPKEVALPECWKAVKSMETHLEIAIAGGRLPEIASVLTARMATAGEVLEREA